MEMDKSDFWAAKHSMFVLTYSRIERELYVEPPMPDVRTLMKWMMTDPQYADILLRVQARDCHTKWLLSKSLMLGAAARGGWRQATSWLSRRFAGS